MAERPIASIGNVVYQSSALRVREVSFTGSKPIVFVDHIGSMTVLPLARDGFGNSVVLALGSAQYHGVSVLPSLPKGNPKGGFDHPEDAITSAIRIVGEETGYGPRDSERPDLDIFSLPVIGEALHCPRLFAVIRDLVEQPGLRQQVESEDSVLKRIAVEPYIDCLIGVSESLAYPEVHNAFIRANLKVGRDALHGWVLGDIMTPGALDVPGSFAPWMRPLSTNEH